MKASKLHSLLFLLLIALAVYFPAINNNFNSVDDIHIIKAYGINGQRTLQQILLPGNQFYFRPIIELTYFFDNLLWDLDPSFMHLENIFLHALNVLMVYHLAVRVQALSGGLSGLPFMSAMLFAVHPINTEAVSWIAGRTDPLAAFFILLSTIFLLKACQFGRVRDFFISFAALLLSLLVKETSFMLIPTSVLLLYSITSEKGIVTEGGLRIRRWMRFSYFALLIGSGGYVVVRIFLKPVGSDNAFSMLFQNSFDPVTIIGDILLAVGFYVKKLIFPFPLNFAVDILSAWYIVPGVLAVLSTIYLFKKRNILKSFALVVLIFIVPAVIVKLAGINWTPVAERYLYIPSAFFSIWISAIVIQISSYKKLGIYLYYMITVIICFAAFFTFKRNQIWHDNLSLYQDAVIKSPNFGDVHNELGIALIKVGEYQTARKHFFLAQQLSTRPMIRELARLNQLNCDLQGKTLSEQRNIIRNYVSKHDYIQPDLLRLLRNITHKLVGTEVNKTKRLILMKEIIALNERIFSYTNDPHCLYSNGQIMIALGNYNASLEYLRKVVVIAPANAYYLESAKKLIHQLE